MEQQEPNFELGRGIRIATPLRDSISNKDISKRDVNKALLRHMENYTREYDEGMCPVKGVVRSIYQTKKGQQIWIATDISFFITAVELPQGNQ